MLLTQARWHAGGGPFPEGFYPAFASPLHPLAHSSLGDAQSPSYRPLVPTLLFEFQGSEAANSPIGSLARQRLLYSGVDYL